MALLAQHVDRSRRVCASSGADSPLQRGRRPSDRSSTRCEDRPRCSRCSEPRNAARDRRLWCEACRRCVSRALRWLWCGDSLRREVFVHDAPIVDQSASRAPLALAAKDVGAIHTHHVRRLRVRMAVGFHGVGGCFCANAASSAADTTLKPLQIGQVRSASAHGLRRSVYWIRIFTSPAPLHAGHGTVMVSAKA